jgi:hypothetical protein
MAGNARVDFIEDRNGRTYLSRSAVPALESIMFYECGLHRMQDLGTPQSFNRRYSIAFVHDRKREARIDAPAIYKNRARTALAMIASLLGPGQMDVLAQRIQERSSCIDQ